MRQPRVAAPVAGLLVTGLLLGGVVLLAPGDEFSTARRLFGLEGERHSGPPEFTPGEGSFAFLLTQRGSDDPVAYDPCQSVEYVVNPEGAPDGWQALVDAAVASAESASGFNLRDAGTTDERPFDPRQRRPFSGTSEPVVIGFADSSELDGLSGDVAGLGGSLAVRDVLGRDYYVTGSVALDTAVFTDERAAREAAGLQSNRP